MYNTTMVYDPAQWNQFFVMVGGGAAALAGLVFVAMTLNVEAITLDATHRFRAMGTLTGFLGIFSVCSLVLMGGQDHQAIGIEPLDVSNDFAVELCCRAGFVVMRKISARNQHRFSAF